MTDIGNLGLSPAWPAYNNMFLYRPTRSVTGKRFTRLGRTYITMMALILAGYGLAGRGFAYLGVAPIFIGEITLIIGFFALGQSGQAWRVLRLNYFMPLLMFMTWGVFRSYPYLRVYGFDTIRDAVIYGYGLFAIVTAGVLLSVPERLALLIKYFEKYAVVFLMLLGPIWVGTRAFGGYWPINPLTGMPVIEVKGGDACVQIAGIFIFLSTLGGGVNPWIGPIFIPLDVALNLEGRAGILSFGVGSFLALVLKPMNPRTWRVFGVFALAIMLFWATDFKIENVGGGREISFDYALNIVKSIVGNGDANPELEGTKTWRLNWWHEILDYTVYGKYFWTGKGFGINLANDDGFQTDGNLRSPHNGHLMILARSGVPGFLLWALTQFSFGGLMLVYHIKARRRGDYKWAGLFLILLGYWAALLTNATFDVFLEGPMGGIWLWNIYGIGVASTIIFQRYPQVLYMPQQAIDV